MAKAGNLVPYYLPSQSPAAAANFVINMRDLPKMNLGAISHCARIKFRTALTLTFSAGTMTVVAQNQCLQALNYFDGESNRFTGGYLLMRAMEFLADGKIRNSDPNNGTTTETRYFSHDMDFLPRNFAGAPSDGEVPVALMDNAQISGQAASLAQYGGTVSAATQTLSPVAWLALRENEIRIPPVYEVKTQSVTGGQFNLSGRAAYDVLAVLDATAWGDLAAGDLASISLDLGKGFQIPAILAQDLGAAFLSDKKSGALEIIEGEPAAATDANARIIDRTSTTALTPASKAIQPVLWSQPDNQLTKLPIAESTAVIKWSGTQTGASTLISGRFLPQNKAMVEARAQKAVGSLGKNIKGFGVKTLSKGDYAGSHIEFMPYKIKTA